MNRSFTNKEEYNKQPLVSVVTPSLNQGQFIEQTILSVKNQHYPNIEHIIIDGGSTDNTLDIIKKYEDTYNMCWISESDKGQADAINKGFKMARGEIIGWLNSDDVYFDSEVIFTIARAFSIYDVDIIYGDAIKINEKNKLMKIRVSPNFNYGLLTQWCYIIQPTVFFKVNVVKEEILNVNLNYSMDYEFWLRLGKKYKWKHITKIIAADRNHPDRKIIRNSMLSGEETRKVKNQFCESQNLFYKFPFNNIYKGWYKFKGLAKIKSLYYNKKNYSFNIKFDSLLKFIINQIFIKDKSLI
ncbi:MAG: glycosyltransferase family 2 protein [Candidatus Helarchaeota archaeon]